MAEYKPYGNIYTSYIDSRHIDDVILSNALVIVTSGVTVKAYLQHKGNYWWLFFDDFKETQYNTNLIANMLLDHPEVKPIYPWQIAEDSFLTFKLILNIIGFHLLKEIGANKFYKLSSKQVEQRILALFGVHN